MLSSFWEYTISALRSVFGVQPLPEGFEWSDLAGREYHAEWMFAGQLGGESKGRLGMPDVREDRITCQSIHGNSVFVFVPSSRRNWVELNGDTVIIRMMIPDYYQDVDSGSPPGSIRTITVS